MAGAARAEWLAADAGAEGPCAAAIRAAEAAHGVPPGLLGAIGKVESGRRDAVSGALQPWPWTIDVDGEGHVYASEAEAIAAVRQFQAGGHASIDVGCMQVNLHQHPDAFADLASAFSPGSNVDYAARFLGQLHDQTGNWMLAAGEYHSATPALSAPYRAKVMAMLGGADLERSAAPAPRLAMASSMPVASIGGIGGGMVGGFGGMRRMRAGPALPYGGPTGRSLAAYRAVPIQLARR